jgi:parallel beta helix pectate lyase-like protein
MRALRWLDAEAGMKRLLVLAALAVSSMAAFVPQAAATHVSCGDVLSQNTVLDSDLVDCPGNGVELADGVTLDLAGHTIDGQGIGAGVAVLREPFAQETGVRVVGGTLQEFSWGLRLQGATGAFDGLVLARNLTAGAECRQAPFVGSSTFSDTVVRGNGVGIEVSTCAVRVEHSAIHENGRDGVFLNFGRFDLSDSAVFDNGSNGVVLDVVSHATIVNNSIHDNVHSGLHALFGVVRVSGNSFAGNGLNGLDVEVVNSTVEGNTAARNAVNGIRLGSDSTHVADGNRTTRNGADGILVTSGAEQFDVSGNRSDRNGDDGIDVDAQNGAITGNRADHNADLGIEAVPGAFDGGGNRARHNGNRLQCLNVTCK